MSVPVVCVLREHGAVSEVVQERLAEAARSLGFMLVYADDVRAGERWTDTIRGSIADSDIVVAIVDDRPSASLWLDIGMALAFRKPTVTIYSSEMDLPDEIHRDALKVGPIVTVEAIARALRRANRDSTYPQPSAWRPNGHTGAPLGSAADELIGSLDAVVASRNERAFEHWFSRVLDAAGVPYDQSPLVQSDQRPRQLDFVVTADEFEGNLGNPLPVELKLRVSPQYGPLSLRDVLDGHLRATGARTVLLLTGTSEDGATLFGAGSGVVLACNARTLVEAMSSATFGRAVIGIRNKVAHGEML